MKILYIGNYNDGTGWGNAALNNILALDSAGVNVVPRAITFNNSNNTTNQRIKQLEAQSERGCDVCIQHTLPNLYHCNTSIKNIGIFYTETSTFSESMWPKYINLMDEAWVANSQMVRASIASGVKIPTKVCPLPIHLEDYENVEDCASIGEFDGCFNFCFVGEFVKRKNIEALLRAYHTEFHPSEPVNLFLKLSMPGVDSNSTLEQFDNFASTVKAGLKIRKKYRKEVAITGMLEKKHLISLMSKCDCFVMPSFGEAWCIPALEAMALGLPVIHTQGTGMDDFCVGWPVQSKSTRCYLANDSLQDVYTSLTSWKEVDVESLASTMRIAYETYKNDKQEWQKMKALAKETSQNYTIRKIGQAMKELLNG
mgnify:FL=1|tara:strand:- start:1289 stop:2395 length:1107 start_codon:yes stop_codon:yes gene_type:complete